MTDPFSRHIAASLRHARDEIAIVAAFVQETGLDRIETHARSAVARGARVRILTGDYLDITQASALELLLDWERTSAATDDDDVHDVARRARWTARLLEARIIEVDEAAGADALVPPEVVALRGDERTASPSSAAATSRARRSRRASSGTCASIAIATPRPTPAFARPSRRSGAERARSMPTGSHAYAERARNRRRHALPPGEAEAEPLDRRSAAPRRAARGAREAPRGARRRDGGARSSCSRPVSARPGSRRSTTQQLREEIGRAPSPALPRPPDGAPHAGGADVSARSALERRRAPRVGWFVGDEARSLGRPRLRVRREARAAGAPREARRPALRLRRRRRGSPRRGRLVPRDPRPRSTRASCSASPRRRIAPTPRDILGLFDDHVAYRADIDAASSSVGSCRSTTSA